jgi:hypothetical protein
MTAVIFSSASCWYSVARRATVTMANIDRDKNNLPLFKKATTNSTYLSTSIVNPFKPSKPQEAALRAALPGPTQAPCYTCSPYQERDEVDHAATVASQ